MAPLLTTMVGVVYTVTVETAVLELRQPKLLVPVTLYEVVETGFTVGDPLE